MDLRRVRMADFILDPRFKNKVKNYYLMFIPELCLKLSIRI